MKLRAVNRSKSIGVTAAAKEFAVDRRMLQRWRADVEGFQQMRRTARFVTIAKLFMFVNALCVGMFV